MIPRSVRVGLVGPFATRAGTLLDGDRPIVLVADPGFERESALRLGRIGLDRVAETLLNTSRSKPAKAKSRVPTSV